MGQARSLSFLFCLRRKTRSARRKETRRCCREELRASKNVPLKRLSCVFRVRRLLQQTRHPKSLRVSVPPFPPCFAPQAPPSRKNPCLISIPASPLAAACMPGASLMLGCGELSGEPLAISCRSLPPVGPDLRVGRAKGWFFGDYSGTTSGIPRMQGTRGATGHSLLREGGANACAPPMP